MGALRINRSRSVWRFARRWSDQPGFAHRGNLGRGGAILAATPLGILEPGLLPVTLTSEAGNLEIQVRIRQPRRAFPGLHRLSRTNREFRVPGSET